MTLYKDFLGCVVTEGIHSFREKHNCYWLFSDLMVVAMSRFRGKEDFLNCQIKVNLDKKSAVLTIDDGNNNKLYTQKYTYTDLKESLGFYACYNELGTFTIMLKEEY